MKKVTTNENEKSASNSSVAFNEGVEDNTSRLNAAADQYEDVGGEKITNQDQSVTNAEDQDEISEDSKKDLNTKQPTVEKEKGPSGDDGSPEINTPVYEPMETYKKIPKMKET